MLSNNILAVLALSVGALDVVFAQDDGGAKCLDASVINEASSITGQGDAGSEDGQAPSLTDPANANFIDFCKGKTITNGLQTTTGSCNPVPMGDIPSVDNMVSSMIQNPKQGDDIEENTTFNIDVAMIGLNPGNFVNPKTNYYSAPQQVQDNGNIVGHTHVTVQDLGGSMTPTSPADPKKFAFFKGINDQGQNDGNGNVVLSASVAGGLKAGVYRLCTMSAGANHQCVTMPVAQRGAQDDCIRFTVGGAGGNAGGNGQGGANAGADGADGADDADGADADGADAAGADGAGAGTAGGNDNGGTSLNGTATSGADTAAEATPSPASPLTSGGVQIGGGDQADGAQAAGAQAGGSQSDGGFSFGRGRGRGGNRGFFGGRARAGRKWIYRRQRFADRDFVQ
ncbi:MAG: hypothetical protein M1825_004853 [Sarcosagium campestre]|nr:MAG: hypothetical protein M1825_004853 [Sarcosagium campestre]